MIFGACGKYSTCHCIERFCSVKNVTCRFRKRTAPRMSSKCRHDHENRQHSLSQTHDEQRMTSCVMISFLLPSSYIPGHSTFSPSHTFNLHRTLPNNTTPTTRSTVNDQSTCLIITLVTYPVNPSFTLGHTFRHRSSLCNKSQCMKSRRRKTNRASRRQITAIQAITIITRFEQRLLRQRKRSVDRRGKIMRSVVSAWKHGRGKRC